MNSRLATARPGGSFLICPASSSYSPTSRLPIRARRKPCPPHQCSSSTFSTFPIRGLHTSRPLYANERNHYETLGLSPGAPQAEVKKRYYQLSKSTHPDRNPDDPNAAARFSAVSDAYATLGNADKRARYDRDVMGQYQQQQRGGGRAGTYSSSQGYGTAGGGGGPNGSRPASGLSKRRSPFRGPPPSFYASGGYGSHGGRRASQAEAHADKARREAGRHYDDPAGWTSSNEAGGFSPGQGGGAQRGFDNDVPHFDRDGHYRTQENVTNRTGGRKQRLYREHIELETAGGMGGGASFLVIGAVVVVAFVVPAWVISMGGGKQKRKGEG